MRVNDNPSTFIQLRLQQKSPERRKAKTMRTNLRKTEAVKTLRGKFPFGDEIL